MDHDNALRKHLASLLDGRGAHADFDAALAGFPDKLRDSKVDGSPHSPWDLLEHMRIAQWDILEFSRNPKHTSPKWPEGYWPVAPSSARPSAWDDSVRQFQSDLDEMKALIADPANDLFARLPHGDGQTLLREALILADHNSHHLGQFILLRRILGAWKD